MQQLFKIVEKYIMDILGLTGVNVLIWAPGWNVDSDKIDNIGESHGSPITITTRNAAC